MDVFVMSALLVVIPLFSSSTTRVMVPVFFQVQPSLKGYGDSPRPSAISRLHISEGVSTEFLLKKVEAEYPHDARGAGVDGDVVFRIIVGTDGRVEEIHLRRGKVVLIEAAAKAVSRWQYAPYMPRGNAVEFETSATIQFRLPNKHQR